MNRRVLLALLASLHLLLSPVVWAQSTDDNEAEEEPRRYYDVELVIFKNINVPKGYEIHRPYPAPKIPDNVIDFSTVEGTEAALEHEFVPLPEARWLLIDEAQSIVNSSRYELLTHTAWTQPGLAEEDMLPVRIRAGEIMQRDLMADPSIYDPAASATSETTNSEPGNNAELINNADEPKDGLFELTGTVSIELSRYLHIHPDLVLRKRVTENPLPSGDNGALSIDASNTLSRTLIYQFPLTESRRMRSKRLHYLDHPEFGLLVLITPSESPLSAANTQP